MDIRKVKKLIELLEESGIGEIEIHEGEESVRISRFGSAQPAQQAAPVVQQVPAAQAISAPPITQAPSAPAAAAPPQEAEPKGHTVKSPMVGTVYLAATPGAQPFVKAGQHVEVGDTLCVIEAMKMFNQIEADTAGTISARLIENEQAVEYDQPLFIIEE